MDIVVSHRGHTFVRGVFDEVRAAGRACMRETHPSQLSHYSPRLAETTRRLEAVGLEIDYVRFCRDAIAAGWYPAYIKRILIFSGIGPDTATRLLQISRDARNSDDTFAFVNPRLHLGWAGTFRDTDK